MANNLVSLKPAGVLRHMKITLNISYFLNKTKRDDVINHVTLLRSVFLLTLAKTVCH